jgi:hypothetical protein
MTKDEKLEVLKTWQTAIENMQANLEPLEKALMFSPESPLIEAIHVLQDACTQATGMALGDDEMGWMSWYWLENRMGKTGYEAGFDGNLKPIKMLDDLLWLIETSQERQG